VIWCVYEVLLILTDEQEEGLCNGCRGRYGGGGEGVVVKIGHEFVFSFPSYRIQFIVNLLLRYGKSL
jgi:hypothetical protein